jgi:hypothetical protein
MKLRAGTCFDIFWVIFFAAIFISGLTLEFEAALIPLLVSGLCLVFAVINLVKSLAAKEKVASDTEKEMSAAVPAGAEGPATIPAPHKKKKARVDPKVAWRRFLIISAWLIGFVAATYIFGHYVAIPAFTLWFLRSKQESWVLSLSCAAAVTAGVYLAIVLGTRTPLYEGLLFSLFGME